MNKLDIANQALAMVGKTRITDFVSEREGQIVDQMYPFARNYVLRRFDWSSCQVIGRLTRSESNRDAWRSMFLFPRTPPIIRISEIAPDLPTDDKPNYELGEDRIYTNTDELQLKYVYEVDRPTLFDDSLALAIATVLASFLAMPLANSIEMQGKYEQMAELRIREARHQDYMQNNPDRGEYVPWMENIDA